MRAAAAVIAFLCVLLGACSADLSDLPVPDGAPGDTYRLEAEFTSALNLPRGAPVKLEGRVVGSVEDLAVRDYVAVADLRVDRAVPLPVGTRAEVRLTAPVGEAFVALLPPEGAADDTGGGAGPGAAEDTGGGAGPGAASTTALLADGDRLGIEQTSTAPDTTDLLTALSTAVTGGTYADVGTITRELSIALDDRGDDVQHLLGELDELASSANANRASIDAALDSLDALAAGAATESDSLAQSVTQLRPALDAAVRLQDPATELLAAVTGLSTTTQALLRQTSDEVVAQVGDAAVVLEQIAAQQGALVPILTGVSAFGQQLDVATPGDYTTFDLSIEGNIDLSGDLPILGGPGSLPQIGPFTPSLPPIEQTLTNLLSLVGGAATAPSPAATTPTPGAVDPLTGLLDTLVSGGTP